MERQSYRVTDKAGPKVAGRTASPGEVLDLTEPEARYEVMAGTIVPVPAEAEVEAGAPKARRPKADVRKVVEGLFNPAQEGSDS